jgi:hypothetical protein
MDLAFVNLETAFVASALDEHNQYDMIVNNEKRK